MPYALSFLEHGWPPSWRYVPSEDDVDFDETYYDAGAPDGLVWDDVLETLRAPTPAETAAIAARDRLRAQRTEAWIAPTLVSSWVNFGTPLQAAGYRIEADRRVHLRGAIKNGSGAGATIFTLPAGYRPTADRVFVCLRAGPGIARVDIESGGAVKATDIGGNNTMLSFEGVSFDVV